MEILSLILNRAARAPIMALMSVAPLIGAVNHEWSKVATPPAATTPVVHHTTYVFEGKATVQGKPCAKASVYARVDSPEGRVFTGTISRWDGSYEIVMPVDTIDNQPVGFFIGADSADFKRVELSGRNVVTADNDSVTIVSSLALQPSAD
jgi:hypothetical protein